MDFSVERFPSALSAAETLARRILRQIEEASGQFRLAIPGGRSPLLVFQRLTSLLLDADRRLLGRLQLFWVDERALGPHRPESNYRLAMESFGPLNLRADQIFRIQGELGAGEAAARYSEQLQKETKDRAFDLALLGLGADGHIASIFPGDLRASGDAPLVYATEAPVTPRERITVSMQLLNGSRKGILLALGEEKSAAFASLKNGEPRISLPASLLNPSVFTIVCDAACSPSGE